MSSMATRGGSGQRRSNTAQDQAEAAVALSGATWSMEAEQGVLGAAMVDAAEALPLAAQHDLATLHFHNDFHAHAWNAVLALHQRGQDVDPITVAAELRDRGIDPGYERLAYLNSTVASVVSVKHAGSYARIVVEKARRRTMQAEARLLHNVAASDSSQDQFDRRVGEILQRLAGAAAPTEQRRGRMLPLEWASEFPADLEASHQLVEGLLEANRLSMWHGAPNSGKTYLACHLALCVSAGRPWLGRRTDRATVIYIAAEGAYSIRQRAAADRRHHRAEPGAFGLVPAPLTLLEPHPDVDALINLVQQTNDTMQDKVGLIVIDTAARVMVGADENSAQDMGRLIGALDRVRSATGAHVLVIHHTGKDTARGARGHSSLLAAIDTEIEVTVDEATKTHFAKVTKQRDLPSKGERFAARLVPVDLGRDQWGNPVTACAVVPSEGSEDQQPTGRPTPGQQAVMGYLAGLGKGARRVDLVEAVGKQGISRSTAFRAIKDLLQSQAVIEVAGVVYLPKVA